MKIYELVNVKNFKALCKSFFWERYNELPEDIKNLVNKKFDLLKRNPYHPSLHLKKVGNYWSARVSNRYRTVGIEIEEGIVWFWIGRGTVPCMCKIRN